MKANKEFSDKINICKNCGKEFHPRYSSKGLFCSHSCQQEYKSKEAYKVFISNPEKYKGRMNIRFVKPYILEEQEHKCSICGMPDTWNNKPLVFILDHIDGNADNNSRSNLRLVCPNCDSQLDTYKSKNKNGARYYYRYGKKGNLE
jgi:hypothetical protein